MQQNKKIYYRRKRLLWPWYLLVALLGIVAGVWFMRAGEPTMAVFAAGGLVFLFMIDTQSNLNRICLHEQGIKHWFLCFHKMIPYHQIDKIVLVPEAVMNKYGPESRNPFVVASLQIGRPVLEVRNLYRICLIKKADDAEAVDARFMTDRFALKIGQGKQYFFDMLYTPDALSAIASCCDCTVYVPAEIYQDILPGLSDELRRLRKTQQCTVTEHVVQIKIKEECRRGPQK